MIDKTKENQSWYFPSFLMVPNVVNTIRYLGHIIRDVSTSVAQAKMLEKKF